MLTHGSAFDYVSTSKGKGYIRNTHPTTEKPKGKTAFIKNPRNRTVNLRQGPGKKYKLLAKYRPGTKVTLLQYGKTWCKVSVKGVPKLLAGRSKIAGGFFEKKEVFGVLISEEAKTLCENVEK